MKTLALPSLPADISIRFLRNNFSQFFEVSVLPSSQEYVLSYLDGELT